jgi:predicted MFS family arabinose efflux permease
MVVAGLFGGGLNAMFYLLPGSLADIDNAHVGTMAGVILSLSQIGAVAASIVGAQVLTTYGLEASASFVAVPVLFGLVMVTRLHLDGKGEPAGGEEGVPAGVGDD